MLRSNTWRTGGKKQLLLSFVSPHNEITSFGLSALDILRRVVLDQMNLHKDIFCNEKIFQAMVFDCGKKESFKKRMKNGNPV